MNSSGLFLLYVEMYTKSSLLLCFLGFVESCPPPRASRLSSLGEWERDADGHKSGGQYVAVLFGLQLPLTYNPFK